MIALGVCLQFSSIRRVRGPAVWRLEGKGESEGDSGGGLCEIIHKIAQPQTPRIFFCILCLGPHPPSSGSDITEAKACVYIATLIVHLISARSHYT